MAIWNKKRKKAKSVKSSDTKTVKEVEPLVEEKREHPRICLIDVNPEINDSLEARGHNCFQGTLGPVLEVPNTTRDSYHQCLLNYQFPENFHEYDIVIIDLQNPIKHPYSDIDQSKEFVKGSKTTYLSCSFPKTVFDPRALSADILSEKLTPLLQRDSILIVLAAPQEEIEYQFLVYGSSGASLGSSFSRKLYDFYEHLPETVNILGKDSNVVSNNNSLSSLLLKHNSEIQYNISFEHPSIWDGKEYIERDNFIPLLVSGEGKTISFVDFKKQGPVFFFPIINNKEEFLTELLEEVLPEYVPSIFPSSTKFSWLKDPHYILPNEQSLLDEKALIVEKYKSDLSDANKKLDENYKRFSYLHDLLKESGATLVKAVEQYLNWLGFEDVVNVDETDPSLKEEDIRIESEKGLLVIEIKGIGGRSTDSDCSQISKVRYRRSKERKRFDVFGLYCVNHQRHLPPKNRDNPPFNSTQMADAESDERGLVTTFDLFKLYFNITKGYVTKEDARDSLHQVGFVSFPPSGYTEIAETPEIHHGGSVIIVKLEGLSLHVGQDVILDHSGIYSSATIKELRLDDEPIQEVNSGEVGVRLTAKVTKETRVWISNRQ